MLIPQPIILFIDAYDSFSNNIISLLEVTLSCSVRTIKIDDPLFLSDNEALHKELKHYAAVVCGPGPGNPTKEEDIGIISRIWKLGEDDILPVLGVCLGFQSLVLEFGGSITRLNGPQHGIIRNVKHIGEQNWARNATIFDGLGEINATHYQSLCADVGQHQISSEQWDDVKWNPFKQCPDIIPLAWVESDLSQDNDSGVMDTRVLVAAQHRSKPFWALQYHPESICTNGESNKVIKQWFQHAQRWNRTRERRPRSQDERVHGQFARRQSLLSRAGSSCSSSTSKRTQNGYLEETICYTRTIDNLHSMSVPRIAEVFQSPGKSQIILESTNAFEKSAGTADVRGKYSIVALDVENAMKFEYTVGNNTLAIKTPTDKDASVHSVEVIDLQNFGGIWPFLAQYLNDRKARTGYSKSPFWGGFMGYTTYEMGLEGIDTTSDARKQYHGSRPDLCFAWVTRSLIVDHEKNVIYLQHLTSMSSDLFVGGWMDEAVAKLERASLFEDGIIPTPPTMPPFPSKATQNYADLLISISSPADAGYEAKVRHCQDFISSGDSYELCLTDRTTVTKEKSCSWDLYKALRARQPAPFASYVYLGNTTLVSASPERFLKWDENESCSLRPMKGTVRKTEFVNTLKKAKGLLDVPKEKAENLMIVDLVRHDLHSVCGSGNVQVPRLMVVEEYKSVFQMISVVEGQIPSSITPNMSPAEIALAQNIRHTGLDVLAASLPPGSMTGAPKKRSCEILQGIEGRERGLYSGVVGYIDVRGRGDWSVTIRSMFRYDDEVDGEIEKWHIGAGGAVTTLSTPVGERDEMLTKLKSTLGVFV